MRDLRLILVVFFSVFVLGVACASAQEIGISTGPSNLAYYAAGKDIKAACPDLAINIFESNGAISNLGNITMRNDVQLAIAPMDSLKYYSKTNAGKASKIGVIAPLYKNGVQVVANARSGIKNVRDLNGKRVNRGPVGSGSWVASQLIEILVGIKFKDSVYSTTESLRMVMNGELDAAFYFSGVPTPDLLALGKEGDGVLHLVSMDDARLTNFGYEATVIPENTYAWEHNAVTIIQVQNYLVGYISSKTEGVAVAGCLKSKIDWLADNGNVTWKGVDLNAEVKWPWFPGAKEALGR